MSPRTNRILTDGALVIGAFVAMPFVGELAGRAGNAVSGVVHPILGWALLCGLTGLLVVASRMKFGAAAAIAARFLLLMPIIGFVALAMQFAVHSFRLFVDGFLRGGRVEADIMSAFALALIGVLLLAVIYIMRWRLRMLIVLAPALVALLPFLDWSGPIFVSLCGDNYPVWPDPVPPPAPPAPDIAMADNSPYTGCGAPKEPTVFTE
jgi:hypothetical protein